MSNCFFLTNSAATICNYLTAATVFNYFKKWKTLVENICRKRALVENLFRSIVQFYISDLQGDRFKFNPHFIWVIPVVFFEKALDYVSLVSSFTEHSLL